MGVTMQNGGATCSRSASVTAAGSTHGIGAGCLSAESIEPPPDPPGGTTRVCPTRRPWGAGQRGLRPATAEVVIGWWRARLGVPQPVRTERISRFQVTGAAGRPGESLVGVRLDHETATIYHTRALTAEDIVHELLHVA